MKFEQGYLYHIYNQGNNQQKIFFNRDNYLFFLKKIRTHILPYADILAWCLMPNHFHLMVLFNGGATSSRTPIRKEPTSSRTPIRKEPTSSRTPINSLNKEIGIMLASYTRAINIQNNTTGSLFREKTKAECINCPQGIAPSFIIKAGITEINIENPEKQYPQVCFNYIHQNPVKAGLVKSATDWEFSSAKDYAGIRKGSLINKNSANEYISSN